MCAALVESEALGASGASVADDATARARAHVRVRVRVGASGVKVGVAVSPAGEAAPAGAAPAAPAKKTWPPFVGTHTWEYGVLSYHVDAVSAEYVKEKLVPKLEASLYAPVAAQGAQVRVTWQACMSAHACTHVRALALAWPTPRSVGEAFVGASLARA